MKDEVISEFLSNEDVIDCIIASALIPFALNGRVSTNNSSYDAPLYCIVTYCIVMHRIVLYYIALDYIVVYSTYYASSALFFTIVNYSLTGAII